jgi:hypothetical protein
VFLVSSVISVVATFIFIMVLIGAIGTPAWPQPSEEWVLQFLGGIGVIPFFGWALFIVGIGLVGWIRSKLLGVITTVAALLGFTLYVYVMISMSASQ